MQKRLQIALMAASAIATSLFLAPSTHAASNAAITPTTDDSGHKIYVNDVAAPAPRQSIVLATATAAAPLHASASALPWRLPGDLHLNHQDPVVAAHLVTREAGKGYKTEKKPSS